VNEYKLYFFDQYGRIRRSMDLMRPSDEDAIAEAKIFVSEHGLELWRGKQKVATLGASRPT
jgi:hypothetical protein